MEATTKITLAEIRKLSDDDILELLRKYPFEKQWEDSKALACATYCLALIQGKKYLATGNKNSFKTTNYR